MERAVGVEPTLMGWKPSAYADRPGPQEKNSIVVLVASVITLGVEGAIARRDPTSSSSRINFNR